MSTKYFKITEKELQSLMDVSDSMMGMSGCEDQEFNREAKAGKKAIDSVLKRAGLKRKVKTEDKVGINNQEH